MGEVLVDLSRAKEEIVNDLNLLIRKLEYKGTKINDTENPEYSIYSFELCEDGEIYFNTKQSKKMENNENGYG